MTSPAITGNEPSTPAVPDTFTLPSVVEDPLLSTLPGAVIAQQESPAVMRIGVVAAINEGSMITVRISGSDVLLDCSYLFNQYWPLLGDRVIVMKQDSQWVCLGQMSGPVGSNNPLPNSSFEEGVIGSLPTGWTLTVGLTGAGVPTFTVAGGGGTTISGLRVVDFGTDSVGAGVSTAEAFSPTVPALPGSKWTAAYFVTSAIIGSIYPMYSDISTYIEFLDPTGVVLVGENIDNYSTGVDIPVLVYRRLSLTLFPAGFVVAPAGTASARVTMFATFELPAASYASFFIDNVILRQVD